MILFREVYKSANDDIIPDSQLLDKILSEEPKKQKSVYSFYAKYGSMAAAFLILVGTLAIYPKLSETLNTSNDNAAPGTDVVITKTESSPETSPEFYESKTAKDDEASTKNEKSEDANQVNEQKPQNNGEQKTKEKTLPEATSSPSPTEKAVKSEEYKPESSDAASEATIKAPITNDEHTPSIASAEDFNSTPATNTESSSESELSTASEKTVTPEAPTATDTSVYAIRRSAEDNNQTTDSPASGGGGSGAASGGGSSGGGSAKKATGISESEAIELANKAFLEDFGEEFLNLSKIKTEFNENYIITRYNENVTYTVTVTTDGLLKKQY